MHNDHSEPREWHAKNLKMVLMLLGCFSFWGLVIYLVF